MIRHLLDMLIPSRRRRWWLGCQDVFPVVSEFIDKEINPTFMEKLQRHFEDCAPCRNLLRSLEKTKELCAQAPKQRVPEDFEQDLLTRLRQEYQEAKRHLGENSAD